MATGRRGHWRELCALLFIALVATPDPVASASVKARALQAAKAVKQASPRSCPDRVTPATRAAVALNTARLACNVNANKYMPEFMAALNSLDPSLVPTVPALMPYLADVTDMSNAITIMTTLVGLELGGFIPAMPLVAAIPEDQLEPTIDLITSISPEAYAALLPIVNALSVEQLEALLPTLVSQSPEALAALGPLLSSIPPESLDSILLALVSVPQGQLVALLNTLAQIETPNLLALLKALNGLTQEQITGLITALGSIPPGNVEELIPVLAAQNATALAALIPILASINATALQELLPVFASLNATSTDLAGLLSRLADIPTQTLLDTIAVIDSYSEAQLNYVVSVVNQIQPIKLEILLNGSSGIPPGQLTNAVELINGLNPELLEAIIPVVNLIDPRLVQRFLECSSRFGTPMLIQLVLLLKEHGIEHAYLLSWIILNFGQEVNKVLDVLRFIVNNLPRIRSLFG